MLALIPPRMLSGGGPGVVHEAKAAAELGLVFVALLRWQRWLEVTGKANANTRRQYRRLLMVFLADLMSDPNWSGHRDPFETTEDDIIEYLAGYTTAQGASRGMMIRALRSFYGWASERELMEHNPTRYLRAARPKYGPAPSLSLPELDRILAAAEQVDPRARWAMQLQYATGCRIGSLIEVTPDDVRSNADGLSIVFRLAKGDRPYEVPLGPKGAEAVEHLLALITYHPLKTAGRRPTLLGVGANRYRQWLAAAANIAGIKAWSHLLRHTNATIQAEAGVDTRTLMEMLNWETPAMIRRYAARSDRNMRAAAI